MPEAKQPAFMQIPQQLQESGPFTSMLSTPAPPSAREPEPYGGQSRAATGMMLANKFFQGAAQGRIQRFQAEEMNKAQKISNLINWANTTLKNPKLTPEGQQFVTQTVADAIGPLGHEAAKKGDKKNPFVQFASQLFEGMSGGKLPKGTKDINPDAVIGQIQTKLFDGTNLRPEFDKEVAFQKWSSGVQETVSKLGPDSRREHFDTAIAPHLKDVAAGYYPERADPLLASLASRYKPTPTPGSREDIFLGLSQPPGGSPSAPTPPPPSTPSSSQPSGFVDGLTPAVPAETSGGTPPPPGIPAATAAERAKYFDPQRAMLMATVGLSANPVSKPVDFFSPDGKLLGKGQATYYNYPAFKGHPGFTGWVDDNTGEVISDKIVRVGSISQPHAPPRPLTGREKAPRDLTLPDGTEVKKGQWVQFTMETGDPKTKQYFATWDYQTRPPQGRAVSAAEKKFEREIKVYETIQKILSDDTDDPAKYPSYAKYLEQLLPKVQQYYKQSPYLADVQQWMLREIRTGTIKSKDDVLGVLQQMSGRAQQNLTNEQNASRMEHAVSQIGNMSQSVFGEDVAQISADVFGGPAQASPGLVEVPEN